MIHSTTKTSTKYQVVIPKIIRKKINVRPNDTFIIYIEDDDKIVLKKNNVSIKNLKGSIKFPPNYLKKERLSW